MNPIQPNKPTNRVAPTQRTATGQQPTSGRPLDLTPPAAAEATPKLVGPNAQWAAGVLREAIGQGLDRRGALRHLVERHLSEQRQGRGRENRSQADDEETRRIESVLGDDPQFSALFDRLYKDAVSE